MQIFKKCEILNKPKARNHIFVSHEYFFAYVHLLGDMILICILKLRNAINFRQP